MKCRLCNNEKLKLYYIQRDTDQFRYYKCSRCGLVNLDLRDMKITESQHKYAEGFNSLTHRVQRFRNKFGTKARTLVQKI